MIHVYSGKIFDIKMNKEKRRAQNGNAHQRPEPEARTQGRRPDKDLKKQTRARKTGENRTTIVQKSIENKQKFYKPLLQGCEL